MKSIYSLIFLILTSVLIFSCKKTTIDPYDQGEDYFPGTVGSYVIYDVDSTYYDDFFDPIKVVNVKYQLKEKIESIYADNEGRPTLKIDRYIKYYDSLTPYADINWTLRNIWFVNKTESTLEKVENNVRYVKLIFPVKANVFWNLNNQNTINERKLSYVNIDITTTIDSTVYSSVLQTEYDDGDIVLTNREYYTEKYAKNIGLIYKEEISVVSQPEEDISEEELQLFYSTPIIDRATAGYSYTWSISSYGSE
jgi:hypothetical protein